MILRAKDVMKKLNITYNQLRRYVKNGQIVPVSKETGRFVFDEDSIKLTSLKKIKYNQIIFEGGNKVGKTTTKLAFEKLTNFKYVTIDRSIITNRVYNELFGRPQTNFDLNQYKQCVFIYCYAPKEVVEKRRLNTEDETFTIDELDIYEKYVEWFKSKGFIVYSYDTSKMTTHEIIVDIKKKIEELNQ